MLLSSIFWNYEASNAQFAAASIAETDMLTGISESENTGNDISEFFNDRFEVTVADDKNSPSNGLMTYSVNGGAPDYINFSFPASSYLDPDVCLVSDGNYVYAIVVYLASVSASPYDNYYIMECFYFDYPSMRFYSGGTTNFATHSLSAAIPPTDQFEVNVDGEAVGKKDFAITWDDDSKNYVYGYRGTVDDCAHLCENPTVIYDAGNVGNDPEQPLPDVAFNGSTIYFSYLIANSGWQRIEVASIPESGGEGICSDNPNPQVVYTSNTSPLFGVFLNPRIACPNTSTSVYSANDQDFTVVAAETDYSTYGIIGINYYNGSGWNYIQYYNDGFYINSPLDITTVWNFEPVVTYSEDGNVLVGWLFDNRGLVYTSSVELDAYYPIVLNCDVKGDPNGGRYMNVPNWSMGVSYEASSSLSIAGRMCDCPSTSGPSNLFSFAVDYQEIYTKIAPEGSVNLRLAKNESDNNSINSLLNSNIINNFIPENKLLLFNLHDMLGKQIVSFEGNISSIRQQYEKYETDLNPGIYIGQIESIDATVVAKGKLFIANY